MSTPDPPTPDSEDTDTSLDDLLDDVPVDSPTDLEHTERALLVSRIARLRRFPRREHQRYSRADLALVVYYAIDHGLQPGQLRRGVALARTLRISRQPGWLDRSPAAQRAMLRILEAELRVPSTTTDPAAAPPEPELLHTQRPDARGVSVLAEATLIASRRAVTPADPWDTQLRRAMPPRPAALHLHAAHRAGLLASPLWSNEGCDSDADSDTEYDSASDSDSDADVDFDFFFPGRICRARRPARPILRVVNPDPEEEEEEEETDEAGLPAVEPESAEDDGAEHVACVACGRAQGETWVRADGEPALRRAATSAKRLKLLTLRCGHTWCRSCVMRIVVHALGAGEGAWPPRCCRNENNDNGAIEFQLAVADNGQVREQDDGHGVDLQTVRLVMRFPEDTGVISLLVLKWAVGMNVNNDLYDINAVRNNRRAYPRDHPNYYYPDSASAREHRHFDFDDCDALLLAITTERYGLAMQQFASPVSVAALAQGMSASDMRRRAKVTRRVLRWRLVQLACDTADEYAEEPLRRVYCARGVCAAYIPRVQAVGVHEDDFAVVGNSSATTNIPRPKTAQCLDCKHTTCLRCRGPATTAPVATACTELRCLAAAHEHRTIAIQVAAMPCFAVIGPPARTLLPLHRAAPHILPTSFSTLQQRIALAEVEQIAVCPRCSRLCMLADGCNHLACACGHNFCFLCGQPYLRDAAAVQTVMRRRRVMSARRAALRLDLQRTDEHLAAAVTTHIAAAGAHLVLLPPHAIAHVQFSADNAVRAIECACPLYERRGAGDADVWVPAAQRMMEFWDELTPAERGAVEQLRRAQRVTRQLLVEHMARVRAAQDRRDAGLSLRVHAPHAPREPPPGPTDYETFPEPRFARRPGGLAGRWAERWARLVAWVRARMCGRMTAEGVLRNVLRRAGEVEAQTLLGVEREERENVGILEGVVVWVNQVFGY